MAETEGDRQEKHITMIQALEGMRDAVRGIGCIVGRVQGGNEPPGELKSVEAGKTPSLSLADFLSDGAGMIFDSTKRLEEYVVHLREMLF